MIKNVYQCCYTNAANDTGGTITSGWKTVACTEGIPQDALEACGRFQRGNSSIKRNMVDEDGNDLNLLEIIGDGSYVCLMRSQYGLKDARGRRNMFSHAYIFPWNDQTLYDPNALLTISDTNFAHSENDALEERAELARTDALTLAAALARARIDTTEELALLVCAVYEQMTNQSIFEPLFVQYDGTPEQLRAILYCIYMFLPPYMRKRLVSASAEGNNVSLTNVVFSRMASEHRFFFDSSADTNNVLTSARRAAIERLGFVTYAVQHKDELDVEGYFKRLEEAATSLNVAASTPVQIALTYKVSHLFVVRPDFATYSNGELDRAVDDLLRLKSTKSDVYDDFLASALDELTSREMNLMGAAEDELARRLCEPHSQKLDTAAERYNVYCFSRLETNDAARRLARMSEVDFQKYVEALEKTDQGQQILDAYFAQCALDVGDVSWESLASIAQRSSFLLHKQKTDDQLQEQAWKLYCNSISNTSQAPKALEDYLSFMNILLPRAQLQGCKQAALEAFWDTVDNEMVSGKNRLVYEAMHDGSPKADEVIRFVYLCSLLNTRQETKFLEEAYKNLADRQTFSNAYNVDALRKLIRMVEREYTGADVHLVEWLPIISLVISQYMLQSLLSAREAAVDANNPALQRYVEQMREDAVAEQRNGDRVLRDACKLLLAYCSNNDQREIVPLDVWLLLGRSIFSGNIQGGSFKVFDVQKPAILNEDPYVVVSSSSLMFDQTYIQDAKRYVQSRGEEARIVKSWLNEQKAEERSRNVLKPQVQSMDSRIPTIEEEQNDSDDAGVFGAFSRFAKGFGKRRRG